MKKANPSFDHLTKKVSERAAIGMTRRGFFGRAAGVMAVATMGSEMSQLISPQSAFAADAQAYESIMCMAINGEANSCPLGSANNGGSWNACPDYNPAGKCTFNGGTFGTIQQTITFSDCTQPGYGPGCAGTSDAFCNARNGKNPTEWADQGHYVTCRVLTCITGGNYCGEWVPGSCTGPYC